MRLKRLAHLWVADRFMRLRFIDGCVAILDDGVEVGLVQASAIVGDVLIMHAVGEALRSEPAVQREAKKSSRRRAA